MLRVVRHFRTVVVAGDAAAEGWADGELAHLERNADLFRAWLDEPRQ
jgi:hypothetical protein